MSNLVRSPSVASLDIECPICTDTYDRPRFLQCYHSFCTNCLVQMVEAQHNRNLITCPLRCDQRTILREGGIFTLPLDRFKMSIIETLSEPSIDENVCRNHDERIKHFCRDCNELICSECVLDSHLGHKSSKLEKTLATDLGRKLRKIVESVSDDDAANRMLEGVISRKTTNVIRKSKLEEEGRILEEKLDALNEELEIVENELERDENLTETLSTNLKEFVRSSEKALKDLDEERLKVDQFVGKYCNALKSYQMFEEFQPILNPNSRVKGLGKSRSNFIFTLSSVILLISIALFYLLEDKIYSFFDDTSEDIEEIPDEEATEEISFLRKRVYTELLQF
ncbi:Oidioi.mRNA.OKI2018_I69.chr1.g3066.t1.cds [Oikopleura dioica]|uniref:Oidioi.mRNA.OKI2018_I69.chr1.g3066.t1.cds n=1 Tax=Oikopleura dioica TaxID=34765 RepID=A0ABN7SWK2_OIKDI|nr:Oidioi.mRNA.OKI2018_I69.chr1.g3066.t1.cds [Oikopleura dioica]